MLSFLIANIARYLRLRKIFFPSQSLAILARGAQVFEATYKLLSLPITCELYSCAGI